VLIWTRNKWLAALALVPLPIWTYYILNFSRKIQPIAKSVMEGRGPQRLVSSRMNIAGVHVTQGVPPT